MVEKMFMYGRIHITFRFQPLKISLFTFSLSTVIEHNGMFPQFFNIFIK